MAATANPRVAEWNYSNRFFRVFLSLGVRDLVDTECALGFIWLCGGLFHLRMFGDGDIRPTLMGSELFIHSGK